MLILAVNVHVKPECVEPFKAATQRNASCSVRDEPGMVRFDVLQDHADPTRFLFVEVFRTAEDAHRHKEMEHFKTWRAAVEDMMASPRSGAAYQNVHPDDAGWD